MHVRFSGGAHECEIEDTSFVLSEYILQVGSGFGEGHNETAGDRRGDEACGWILRADWVYGLCRIG